MRREFVVTSKFDPWDWLGVHCGGFDESLDATVLAILEDVAEGKDARHTVLKSLVCTLLCNTDAFEFDDEPTQLRFVGDDRFKTLQDLIDAWDQWYGEHYG